MTGLPIEGAKCFDLVSPKNLTSATWQEFLKFSNFSNFSNFSGLQISFAEFRLGVMKLTKLTWYKIGTDIHGHFGPKIETIGHFLQLFWLKSLLINFWLVRLLVFDGLFKYLWSQMQACPNKVVLIPKITGCIILPKINVNFTCVTNP